MATDIDIMGTISGSGSVDYLLWALGALMLVGVVFGIFMLIKYLLSFNIKVEISKEHSSGNMIIKDMAREIKKNGKSRWEFLKYRYSDKSRAKVNPPNKQYIDILKRGKMFCRFKEIDGNLIPVHPEVEKATQETLKKSTLSVEDRNAMVEDIHDAYNKHKPSSLLQVIEKFMPVITIIILTIMLMIGMNQFGKSQTEIQESQKQVVDSINKGIEQSNELMTKLLMYENTGELPLKTEPPE